MSVYFDELMMKLTNFLCASLFCFNLVISGADQAVSTLPSVEVSTTSQMPEATATVTLPPLDSNQQDGPQREPVVFNWRGPGSYGPLGQEPHVRVQEMEAKRDAEVSSAGPETQNAPDLKDKDVALAQDVDVARYEDDSYSDSRSDDDGPWWRRRRDADDDHSDYGHHWNVEDEGGFRGGWQRFPGAWRGRGPGMAACACDCMCCHAGQCFGGKFRGMRPHGEMSHWGPRERFNNRDDDRHGEVIFIDDRALQGPVAVGPEPVPASITPSVSK